VPVILPLELAAGCPDPGTVAALEAEEEHVVRRFSSWLAAGAAVGFIIVALVARADEDKEKKISEDKLPREVAASIKDRFPGAKLTSIEKEKENGQVVYDIELKHEGRKYEMDIKEDGTIIEIEKEVAAKDVPEAVTKAVAGKYPGASIKEVMEVNKVKDKQETPDHYEVVRPTSAPGLSQACPSPALSGSLGQRTPLACP
jgi:hypothetical protein